MLNDLRESRGKRMKTDGFKMVHPARHAMQWQPAVEPKDDTRRMDLGDIALVSALTAAAFTIGVLVTVMVTVWLS